MANYHINIGVVTDKPGNILERYYVTAWLDRTDKVLTTKFETFAQLRTEFHKNKVPLRHLESIEKTINDDGSWTSPNAVSLSDEQVAGLRLR